MATKKRRVVGIEGVGSPGDVRDRFRQVIKPGAQDSTTGIVPLGNPVKQIGDVLKRIGIKQKKRPTPLGR